MEIDVKIEDVKNEIKSLENTDVYKFSKHFYGWGEFEQKIKTEEIGYIFNGYIKQIKLDDLTKLLEKFKKKSEKYKNIIRIYVEFDLDAKVFVEFEETKEDYLKRLKNWRNDIVNRNDTYTQTLPKKIKELQEQQIKINKK